MGNSPYLPAITKRPQHAALKHSGDVISPAGMLPAVLLPHNLLDVPLRNGAVQALSMYSRHLLTELRGTP